MNSNILPNPNIRFITEAVINASSITGIGSFIKKFATMKTIFNGKGEMTKTIRSITKIRILIIFKLYF